MNNMVVYEIIMKGYLAYFNQGTTVHRSQCVYTNPPSQKIIDEFVEKKQSYFMTELSEGFKVKVQKVEVVDNSEVEDVNK